MTSRFVRVEQVDGRWWFVHGTNRFLNLGVNAIQPRDWSNPPDGRIYNVIGKYDGDLRAWAQAVEQRLRGWNFNTVASWSHEAVYRETSLYHTRMVNFGSWGPTDDRLLDVFAPAYEAAIEETARREVAPFAEEERLIGFFINNELPWYGERGWPTTPQVTVLTRYLRLPQDAPGRERAVQFLVSFYTNNFDAFIRDWRTEAQSFDDLSFVSDVEPRGAPSKLASIAWVGIVADRYYQLCTEAVRRHDKHHLILGSRFAYRAPTPVMEACGRYCDVVSMNHYSKSGVFNRTMMDAVAALTRRPILITEFSWRAMENRSGLKNTHGADVTVATQQDRADRFQTYASVALRLPYLVGYDWFLYHDQPPMGRFDGENSNYGLVDNDDVPYAEITGALTAMNGRAHEIHANSTEVLPPYDPEVLSEYRPVRVREGDRPLAAPIVLVDGQATGATYGDTPAGATIRATPGPEALALQLRSQHGWGCGISLKPNHGTPLRDGAVSGLGASRLVARLHAPAGVRFQITLNESGHGPTESQTFDGLEGADGEAYRLPFETTRDGWHEYAFDLQHVEVTAHYGNQRGNSILDLQALAEVGFTFAGQAAEDVTVQVAWIRLE